MYILMFKGNWIATVGDKQSALNIQRSQTKRAKRNTPESRAGNYKIIFIERLLD